MVEKQKEVALNKQAMPDPPPPPKPDPIAEKIKTHDQAEARGQGADACRRAGRRCRTKSQPKFDADKIAALLDKRDPTRNAATGAELNSAPSLGIAGRHRRPSVAIGNRRPAGAPDGAMESAASACAKAIRTR